MPEKIGRACDLLASAHEPGEVVKGIQDGLKARYSALPGYFLSACQRNLAASTFGMNHASQACMQNDTLQKNANEAKEILSDTKELAKDTAANVAQKAKETRAEFSTQLDDVKEKVGDLTADLRDKAVSTVEQSDRIIRKNPYQTLGVAFGVGVLLGVILNRR